MPKDVATRVVQLFLEVQQALWDALPRRYNPHNPEDLLFYYPHNVAGLDRVCLLVIFSFLFSH